MVEVSEDIKKYFEHVKGRCLEEFEIATAARKKGYDPVPEVEIQLAANMAERVVGLISVVAPQIVGSGVVERIIELEEKYGTLGWRVALQIALEVAQQKFCKFDDPKEAIEVGIRVGFAYGTVGVVSSPLEGLVNIDIKKRLDGKGEYFCLNYAGPIRNAGGTAASWSVIIADYVRKNMGYAQYDPTSQEVKRCATEIEDYHERVTNLQYFPSKRETHFIMEHLPVEISGDASEDKEVSNYKDLPRIPVNKIRSGYCLIHSSCIPLKAEKLWKELSKWGNDFGMEQWNFLEELVKIKKEVHAGKKSKKSDAKEQDSKVLPDYTFIKDLVAGRPVISHPMRYGGFRLRFGRSRTSGYSAQSAHPASMHVTNDFIAIGTQLKVERPGKGAAFTPCDTIEGPVVKLKDGSVVRLTDEKGAKEVKRDVVEVLFLGDALINYGDFLDRAHMLVPPGYCEEWWSQELEKKMVSLFGSIDSHKLSEFVGVPPEKIEKFLHDPLRKKPGAVTALRIAKETDTFLHPWHTYYWTAIPKEDLPSFVSWLSKMRTESDEQGLKKGVLLIDPKDDGKEKRKLELCGIPHSVVQNEYCVFDRDTVNVLSTLFSVGEDFDPDEISSIVGLDDVVSSLDALNRYCPVKMRDKAGIFIGARMGRPEKAKMRKLTGSPHGLFPVGNEGGRMRSFNAALQVGFINAEFATFRCDKCDEESVFSVCPKCSSRTTRLYFCPTCGPIFESECKTHGRVNQYKHWAIPINDYMKLMLKKTGMPCIPDLVKGVRGTSNREHIPEHLSKAILRSKHDIHVNKDGTVRYDASELPITHFKPKEIGVSLSKLKELGYSVDIKGRSLESKDQICELKPQDIIIPCCPDSPDEGSDVVMTRVCNFIDELLVKLYGLKPYYNIKSREDLAGHLVIGLAPHTSAGTVCRIVGFSKSQGFFASPLIHAAMRRDCFVYDTVIPIKKGSSWELLKIGDVVENLNPTDVVDDYGTREVKVKGFKTLGFKNNKLTEVKIDNFTKHTPQPIIEFKTKLGRVIRTTDGHKHIVHCFGKDKVKRASDIKKGDLLKIPYKLSVKKKDYQYLDLIDLFKDTDWVMVKGLASQIPSLNAELKSLKLSKQQIHNFSSKDSVPIVIAVKLLKKYSKINLSSLFVSAKRDHVKIPVRVPVDEHLLKILGLYVAEGYSRKKSYGKGLYQVYIAAQNQDVRDFISTSFKDLFGLKTSENKSDRLTYSSRIIYELFTNTLCMGSSAYEKRMPSLFLNLPDKKLGWLLSGYLEGDGSVSKTDLRITFDTVSKGLLRDIDFIFGQLGVFVKNKQYTKEPGPKLRAFYEKKGRPIPKFTSIKGVIQSKFMERAGRFISFISSRKQGVFDYLLTNKTYRNIFCNFDEQFFFDDVVSIKLLKEDFSYCLNVENHLVVADGILTKQCDGDESCLFMLLDAFLNFSKKYLPESRGSTMDAPLVLTSVLTPSEVDDMAFKVDRVWKYPLEFYEACEQYKMPWDVKIETVNDVLGTPEQYEGWGFTHDTDDINAGVLCSSYKTLPSMKDKLHCQMDLAEKLRAVDAPDVARLVIEKHFIRDIKGNLRKFSMQMFRCVACNEKFRRPPLAGRCTKCGGKIIFTISEGSIVKYLEPSLSLAEKYHLPAYLVQTLELTKRRIEGVFGKEKEKQLGLGSWF